MAMTIGTLLFTWAKGRLGGIDDQGNRYYTERKLPASRRPRRWVIYNGEAEASRVPAIWHGWLHHTFNEPLDASASLPWIKPHKSNPTGTDHAYSKEVIGKVSRQGPQSLRGLFDCIDFMDPILKQNDSGCEDNKIHDQV